MEQAIARLRGRASITCIRSEERRGHNEDKITGISLSLCIGWKGEGAAVVYVPRVSTWIAQKGLEQGATTGVRGTIPENETEKMKPSCLPLSACGTGMGDGFNPTAADQSWQAYAGSMGLAGGSEEQELSRRTRAGERVLRDRGDCVTQEKKNTRLFSFSFQVSPSKSLYKFSLQLILHLCY